MISENRALIMRLNIIESINIHLSKKTNVAFKQKMFFLENSLLEVKYNLTKKRLFARNYYKIAHGKERNHTRINFN